MAKIIYNYNKRGFMGKVRKKCPNNLSLNRALHIGEDITPHLEEEVNNGNKQAEILLAQFEKGKESFKV